MQKEHIAVRVPSGFFVSAAVSSCLNAIEKLNSEPECRYRFTIGKISNYRPADYARNVIVQ